MKRKVLNLLWIPSLVGCVVVCWLWMRGTSGVDSASLTYDRYLADGRAASNDVYLTSDHRLWLTILAGSVAPPDGRVVWGYYINADASKGEPRFRYDRRPYATHFLASEGSLPTDERGMSGWGPFRWQDYRRTDNSEEFRSITIGVSHWLVLIVLLPLPLRRFHLLYCSLRARALAKTFGEPGEGPERRSHAVWQWNGPLPSHDVAGSIA